MAEIVYFIVFVLIIHNGKFLVNNFVVFFPIIIVFAAKTIKSHSDLGGISFVCILIGVGWGCFLGKFSGSSNEKLSIVSSLQ